MKAVRNYLEQLAMSHADIRHNPDVPRERAFFGPSKFEMAMGNARPDIVVYLHPAYGDIEHNGSQWITSPTLGFSILIYTKSDADKTHRELLDRAQEIGQEFLARMRYDKRENPACQQALQYLTLKKVQWFDDGPHGDGYIGRAFRIPMSHSIELEYDSERWL